MDDYMFTLEAGRLPVPSPCGAASTEGFLSKKWHKSGFLRVLGRTKGQIERRT